MRNIKLPFLILISLFLSSCTEVNFKHPLSQPGAQANDARLEGVWFMDDDDARSYIHISKDQEGWLDVVLVGHNKNGEGNLNTMFCEMFTSAVAPYHFMNLRNCRSWDRKNPKSLEEVQPTEEKYWIFLYTFTDAGELTFKELKATYLKKSIGARRLEGFKVKDKSVITITADSQSLARFIQDSDPEKIFEDTKVRFIKLPPPASPPKP